MLATLKGESAHSLAGESVAGAGDVTGDGIPDVLVGAIGFDAGGRYDSGAAYVVSGNERGKVSLGGALRLAGVGRYDYAGTSVAGAGDVDGDGANDVLVGAFNAGTRRVRPGAAYL